ncbi:ATP-binding protein [Micromonospora sp. NPDC049559]|uniref:ATP-binding protein n=1 Tax=Micromonospora sp. NPDC049559 TaxID=3155923 RepID=UPI00341DAAE0
MDDEWTLPIDATARTARLAILPVRRPQRPGTTRKAVTTMSTAQGSGTSPTTARPGGTAGVRFLVETGRSHSLVRLVGVLDGAAAGPVRGALLACLADQPTPAAVVDVSRLRVAEPAALSVFAAVARETADWPSGRLTFCLPEAGPDAGWDGVEVVVRESLAEALALLGEPEAARPLRAEFAPAAGAAREARELATEGCARWGVPELAGSACIALTEMVNNAVAHAATPLAVALTPRGRALHIGVRDYSRDAPTFHGTVPPTSAGGRGMLLVDTVARRWGTSLLPDGKLVWAVLHADDEHLD